MNPKKIILPFLTLMSLAAPTLAFAEEASGQVRENIPAGPFLATAYAFMWVAVLVYVGLVARKLTRVQGDMDDLRRRIDEDARR